MMLQLLIVPKVRLVIHVLQLQTQPEQHAVLSDCKVRR